LDGVLETPEFPKHWRGLPVAFFQRQIGDKTSHPCRGWFRRRHLIQRSSETLSVALAVNGTAEFAVPKEPKCADFLTTIQTAHGYTLRAYGSIIRLNEAKKSMKFLSDYHKFS
jgi:hypothetical protein